MKQFKLVMLKELRYKIVLIIIILVESVLIAHTCLSMYLTYQNHESTVRTYLHTIIGDEHVDSSEFGMEPHHHDDVTDMSNMLSTVIPKDLEDSHDVSATPGEDDADAKADGATAHAPGDAITQDNQAAPEESALTSAHTPTKIGNASLFEIVDAINKSGKTEGHLEEYHVWFLANDTKIALVDTSTFDFAFTHSIIMITCMIGGTLAVVLTLSWILSGWIIRPIADAMHRQRMFLSDASHELKTPLSVILANTDILLKRSDLQETEKKWLTNTADEALHMKHMINDLLELAKSDEAAAGSPNILHKTSVDMSNMVSTIALEYDAIAFDRGCSIETAVDDDIHVYADSELICRLVHIFVDNACKYAHPNTVIYIGLTSTGKQMQLTVTNTADVISTEELEHIFDRFYRSDRARSRANGTGGFGLGLAIAKSIVVSHKGTISATSTKEHGTTFTVVLPLSDHA